MKDAKLCIEPYCKRMRRKGSRLCTTCCKKLWRAKYPMKACFQTLRQNARRRGKEFSLTFEQFEKFCYETNYMKGKGRSSKSYSIDRRENHLGYTEDNIRILPKGDNSRKRNKTLIYDYRDPEFTTVV